MSNQTIVQTKNPEIELLKTCSILLLPVKDKMSRQESLVFMLLEEVALSASFRKYTDNSFGRIFVLPSGWELTDTWKTIIETFGDFKFVGKVC